MFGCCHSFVLSFDMFALPWHWSFYIDVSSSLVVEVCLEFIERPIFFYDWNVFLALCSKTYNFAFEH